MLPSLARVSCILICNWNELNAWFSYLDYPAGQIDMEQSYIVDRVLYALDVFCSIK
jgi:hypothetical protein